MKTKKTTSGYYVQKADTLISTTLAEIKVQVKSYAKDQAQQSRPFLEDPMELFIPKIQGWFAPLLEQVLRIIGAFAILTQTPESIKELYDKEVEKLQTKKEELLEDIRLLTKDLEGLEDISGVITRWKYKWRILLVLLTFGEVAVNYKALLSITPNEIIAILSAIGLSVFLFVTAHSSKEIVSHFSSKKVGISVGAVMVLFVLALLFGLNEIRLSYLENDGAVISDTSKYSYIILVFSLWVGGLLISLLRKPSQLQIEKHEKFQKVKKELQSVKSKIGEINQRLEEIPKELEERQTELHGLKCMAKSYENILTAEYLSTVADFKEHNLFFRKDKITPRAFLSVPPKLKTYFDEVHLSSDQL